MRSGHHFEISDHRKIEQFMIDVPIRFSFPTLPNTSNLSCSSINLINFNVGRPRPLSPQIWGLNGAPLLAKLIEHRGAKVCINIFCGNLKSGIYTAFTDEAQWQTFTLGLV